MPACDDQCPICKTRLADQCCETCGSLEGVDEDSFAASRVFGYDWAAGSVAPWRDAQGRAYATPAELAEVALAAAGLERGGYAIDLGCGDAAILRAAATRFDFLGFAVDRTERRRTRKPRATPLKRLFHRTGSREHGQRHQFGRGRAHRGDLHRLLDAQQHRADGAVSAQLAQDLGA